MTKYQLSRPPGPWDYPAFGFTATDGAILDGTLSTPAVTSPPDAFWTVYGGGSAETGITRYANGTSSGAAAEPAGGAVLAYNATSNAYEPASFGVITPAAYGAAGDGTTDDTAALAAALTAAAAGTAFGPVTVFLPYTSGGYRVSVLTIPTGVTLRGERGVTLKKIGASTATFVVTATSGTDIRIEGLTIDANGLTTSHSLRISTSSARVTVTGCKLIDSGAASGLNGIETRDGTTDILIENNLLDGIAGNAVFVNKNPVRCTVRNNRIINWKTRGIYVLGDATHAASDLTIERNHISDNISTGTVRQPIAFAGVDSNLFQRVRVNYNTIIGSSKAWTAADPGTADQISLHRCVDFEVIGNLSRDGGDTGITIAQQCTRGVVANNVCLNNDTIGIALGSSTSTYARRIAVTGNTCVNNGQNRNGDRGATARAGIWPYNASDCHIAGNVLGDDQGTKTQQYGVSMTACTNLLLGNLDAGNAVALNIKNGAANTNINAYSTVAV